MKKVEQLYEGKAKKVYSTEDPGLVIVSYKDDATAFDGLKKGTITGKGAINNRMTNNLMRRLEEKAVGLQRQLVLCGEEEDEKRLSERGSIRAYTARQSAIDAGVNAKASILEAMMGICSVVASTQQVRCPRAVRCGGFGSASSSWWTRRRRLA